MYCQNRGNTHNGQGELAYLRTAYTLADQQARRPVSTRDIQEALSLGGAAAERYCDLWIRRGALLWSSALGHVVLTHVGAGLAEKMGLPDGPVLPEPSADIIQGGMERASVSVVIPVLDEAKTIAQLVKVAVRSPRVLEVLVVDDGSIDGTPEVAARAGAVVLTSSLLGKGASMEDGVRAASADIILFLDGDLLEIREDLVERMTDPILTGSADMVKARFVRESGRVTTLTARPLLDSFFPELASVAQPLGGIVAARRSLLENLCFENDYGVDVALLIDALAKEATIVEVDIGYVDHDAQSLEALAEMAKQVTRTILDRAWRYERLNINQVLERRELERRAGAQLLPRSLPATDNRPFALFDMDGVLLDGRYVLELARRVGVQREIRGLLDSEILSDEDRSGAIAALFADVPMEVFQEVARTVPLMEGAVDTVVGLRQRGYCVGIVTDSYHAAAETVRRRVFADFCVAHVMHFRKGRATGELTPAQAMLDPQGCSIHKCCKANVVRRLQATMGLRPEDTLAVGDGDNDICMLQMVGTSVAFHPRNGRVALAAKHRLHGPLTEVLDLIDPGVPPHGDRSFAVRLDVSRPPSPPQPAPDLIRRAG